MKSKEEIVNNWLPRYTGIPLEEFGGYILLVNFGVDLHLDPAPEPLLAPPEKHCWQVLWSSEDPQYGGNGIPPLETEENWRIPGAAAIVMKPAGGPADE